MTGTEIQHYVETRMGIEVDLDEVLMAINEAIDMLGDTGLLYDTIDVEVTDAGQWYNLPDDFTYVQKVYTGRGEIYMAWDYRNGQIRFRNPGNYTIVARKMGKHLENISDSITDMHRLYYNAIKFYALAWMKENDDDNDVAAEKYYNRFYETAQQAVQILMRSKAPMNWKILRR